MGQGSRFAFLVLTLCLSVFIVGPVPAQAVTLQVNGSGILTGATGVNAGGTLYDVEFVDGTCVALFNGCNAVSDFTFQTSASALAASQALLTDVLLDGALGTFDSSPNLTRGCENTIISCLILSPHTVRPSPANPSITEVLASISANSSTADSTAGNVSVSPVIDLTSTTSGTWAVWSPTTAVPEPNSLILFGLGLVALILWDYSHRQGRRTGTPLK